MSLVTKLFSCTIFIRWYQVTELQQCEVDSSTLGLERQPPCCKYILEQEWFSAIFPTLGFFLGPCHKNSPNPRSFTLVSTIFLEGLNENWPHLGHFVVHWDFFLLILLSGLVLQFFHWGTRKINFQLCKAPFTLPNFFFTTAFLA